MADRPTEDDLHQEAVQNGEIEGIICQRCPWCTDPGLPEGETAFGVDTVNMDIPRPVGCDVNDCVNVIGYQVNSENVWQEGFEALEKIEDLGSEVLGDSGRAEQFLDEQGVWSWYSSGGDTPGLGWTSTYYCVEGKYRDDLKNAILAEKADLEKPFGKGEVDEVEGGEDHDPQAAGLRDENGRTEEDERDAQPIKNKRLLDYWFPLWKEIRTTLDARDYPSEPSTTFWLYECGLVTEEIFAKSSSGCPRCGKNHPPGENVTSSVLPIYRSEYAKDG